MVKGDNMAKITNKDRDQQIRFLTQSFVNLQKVVSLYIDFKGDDVDFKKHLIDVQAKEKEMANDTEANNTNSDKQATEEV
jgi:hypothetical protein